MKKLISLVAVVAMMLAIAGCTMNANTGVIFVSNKSDKPVKALKVGTTFIGYVAPGEVKTVYFNKAESAAKVEYTGDFNLPDPTFAGTIELKTNYLYTLDFSLIGGKYYCQMSGNPNEKDQMNSTTIYIK